MSQCLRKGGKNSLNLNQFVYIKQSSATAEEIYQNKVLIVANSNYSDNLIIT